MSTISGNALSPIFPAAAAAPFPKSCVSYFRFAHFNTFPLYYLRAWHRLGWWGNNILLSISVRFLVSTFESFLCFREFLPRLSAIFFKRAREAEVKLRHVVYEVWLVSCLFFSFQIWYFRKWIITSIGQSKHMRVTRFNPLWVSGSSQGKPMLSLLRSLWLSFSPSLL